MIIISEQLKCIGLKQLDILTATDKQTTNPGNHQ